jgi:hypothetical protein
MNARSESTVAQALIHSIHCAQQNDMLFAFIKWKGLHLLQAAQTALRDAQSRNLLRVFITAKGQRRNCVIGGSSRSMMPTMGLTIPRWPLVSDSSYDTGLHPRLVEVEQQIWYSANN